MGKDEIESDPAGSRYGETYWMPLSASKNLGLLYSLDTYIRQGFASWRTESVDDLKTWDTDGDGDISMKEVLGLASSKGVNDEWLQLMKSEDPCVILNGQVSANMTLHLLQDIGASVPELSLEAMEALGVGGYET